MPSVLFVCTANRCRSPMAAALFQDLLGRMGLAGRYRVESAGTWAEDGLPATGLARQVLETSGLDLSRHRSRRLNGNLLREFELTLVMEHGHREALRVEFPDIVDRVHLLAAMAGQDVSILDPDGANLEAYQSLADELSVLLRRGLPRIQAALEGAGHHRG